MHILVTFAVEAEFAPWRKLRSFQKATAQRMEYFSTQLQGAEVGVLLTGVGCKKAWVEATKVIWDADVDVCISSGLAGGLRQEHRLGEVLVAENVLASKSDRAIACDPRLVDLAVSVGAKRVSGFYTADRIILDSAEKRNMGAFADAVEMESGEILFEAAAFGGRVVAVRSISDTVDDELPIDFNQVTTGSGEVSIRRILGEAFSKPSSIPALIRFGKQSRNAAGSLAVFLEEYLPKVVLFASVSSSVGA
jgi:adenosylhomocysteine nucleosidase